MKILILGDVHCQWAALNRVIFKAFQKHPDITHMIQVGDLGYAWPRSKPFEFDRRMCNTMVEHVPDEVFERVKNTPFYWLDGNHENFDQLDLDGGAWQPGITYMPRGSVLEIDGKRLMFFGGAYSVDKYNRTEHLSWWRQESITYTQVQKTLETVNGPIDALFTHEHATSIPYSNKYKDEIIETHADRNALQVILHRYQPKFYFFGHHHDRGSGELNGMKWTCCPIIDDSGYTIWDGENIIEEMAIGW